LPVNMPGGQRVIWFHFRRRMQLTNARADQRQMPR